MVAKENTVKIVQPKTMYIHEVPTINSEQEKERIKSISDTGRAIIDCLKSQMNDKNISIALGIDLNRVKWYRSILGIHAPQGTRKDPRKDEMRVTFNKNNYRIAIPLSSLSQELGMKQNKRYNWMVEDVKRGQFTVKIKETE